MRMACVLVLRQAPEQILGLDLAGGATDSIFPTVERRIQSRTVFQKALRAVHGAPDAEGFQSAMDLFLRSVFPEIAPLAFRFYADKGPALRDQITHAGRDALEVLLLGALECAALAFTNGHDIWWEDIRVLLRVLDVPAVRLYPKHRSETIKSRRIA